MPAVAAVVGGACRTRTACSQAALCFLLTTKSRDMCTCCCKSALRKYLLLAAKPPRQIQHWLQLRRDSVSPNVLVM